MTTALPNDLIERIHASGRRFVLGVTGGGTGAIARLLEVPGGSASIVEAVVPYSQESLRDWLGAEPEQACSERTARAMAMRAFERALALGAQPRSATGIGATASLVSSRPKRGAHRIHAAWQSAFATGAISCEFEKGKRTRTQEEGAATALLLELIARASGIDPSAGSLAMPTEPIRRRGVEAPASWTELLLGERQVVEAGQAESTEGKTTGPPYRGRTLFPGAFNPLHRGHERMIEIAARRCSASVSLELSIRNVDKAPLDFIELSDRIGALGDRDLFVTDAPTFVEKARLFPQSTFVVGADTIMRIGDPRYYHGSEAARDSAIAAIQEARCRFLVFGRVVDGLFRGSEGLAIPDRLRNLCDPVPPSEFRNDISSTELRRNAAGEAD